MKNYLVCVLAAMGPVAADRIVEMKLVDRNAAGDRCSSLGDFCLPPQCEQLILWVGLAY